MAWDNDPGRPPIAGWPLIVFGVTDQMGVVMERRPARSAELRGVG